MKDLSHHMKKLNRKVLRSVSQEVLTGNDSPFGRKQTPQEMKKIKKRAALKARKERVPIHLTEEERNRKMKKRVPIFGTTNSGKCKSSKPCHKKVPRI